MANEQFVANFGSKLYRLSLKNNFTNLIFICVGSNKIIGDSLGPMVGNKLKTKLNTKVNVWGTLENPVNYMNIEKAWKNIKDKYKNPCIISIDSAMGKNADVGKILVNWGGIFLGEAIKNGIYCNSHINIKGIVAKSSKSILINLQELNSINLWQIEKLANIVSEGISQVINSFA